MGADDEFVFPFLDDEVVHGNAGQVGMCQRPCEATIERGVKSTVRSAKQQAFDVL